MWLGGDGYLHAGSRKRAISPDKDNAGFATWVAGMPYEVRGIGSVLGDFPDLTVYGEWLGDFRFVGNIKAYDPSMLGHLWIFDVKGAYGTYLPRSEWEGMFSEAGARIIPVIAEMDSPDEGALAELLDTPLVDFGINVPEAKGEGIVIRNEGFVNRFGRYAIAKMVRDDYRKSKSRPKPQMVPGEVETSIVEMWMTDAEISKAVAKAEERFGEPFSPSSSKMMGFVLNVAYNDAVLAEMPSIVKKMKMPTVDFKRLHDLSFERVRESLGL